MKKFLYFLKILAPFVLMAGILWWMYRGTDVRHLFQEGCSSLNWWWMSLSLLFGIVPLVFRSLRWRMALKPLGETMSVRTANNVIYVSYAASLVIPRVGEVARCGMLKRFAGVSFSKSLGTVVSERVVDSILMLLLALFSFVSQLPQFMVFLRTTGFDAHALVGRFTTTGWWVTILCAVFGIGFAIYVLFRLRLLKQTRVRLQGFWDGLVSLRRLRHPILYIFYSIGIWIGYFLHFYIAFFAFSFTSDIGILPALLIFSVGSFAVLVPTPNGAGPWHFAVKTMLILYGVAEAPAILFALLVHTIQTLLIAVLGVIGWADLLWFTTPPENAVENAENAVKIAGNTAENAGNTTENAENTAGNAGDTRQS